MIRLFLFIYFSIGLTLGYSQLPAYYSSSLVQQSYTQPMGTLFNADGTKMFVWTYEGMVYVSTWNGTQYVKQDTPVLNISDEVGGWRDFGLLSMCLDPNFEVNGNIYLFYAVDRHHLLFSGTPNYNTNTNSYYQASISRITRYQLNHQATPMTTDYGSRFILLGESISTGIPLLYESHAGGAMAFGSDGTLMVTTGDNASYATTDVGSVGHTYYQQAINDGIMRSEENVGAMRSQMVNSLCGKILRLDPNTGNGISSNPFYDVNEPRSAESRFWAMGFRNPFRMSIDLNSGSTNPSDANPGTLFVVDVGWNVWEDLHVIDKPGLNAGWPLYEGQTQLNSYYNSGATNPDEGNQLFKDLCLQPTSFIDDTNPTLRRLVHNRPEVAWLHGIDQARVPWFNGTTPTNPRVGATGSPTTGVEFWGSTGVSGVFIDNCGMGPGYNGKYFFTDYIRNFINVATLNDGTQNWISNIEEFAPANFGSGIVHMVQNPRDGSIFYTNIFNGHIRKISFDNPENPTWTIEPIDVSVGCDGNTEALFNEWLTSYSGTDACGNLATLTTNSAGLSNDCGTSGSETVTFTLRTMNGTLITKEATFTVTDATPPTFNESLPGNLSVSCSEIPTAVILTANDACGSATVGFSEATTGSCDTLEIVRTWTATDDCGNTTVHAQTISVIDDTDPVWTSEPLDLTIECTSDINTQFQAWLNSFSGTDNCGSAMVSHDSSGTLNECGDFETVTFVLTDNCGNFIFTSATFTIDGTLNVPKLGEENIQYYPNPSLDYIIFKGLKGKALVAFYNLAGQLIMKKEALNRTPLSFKLASGVYILKIQTELSSVNKKLIVE